MVTQTNNQQFDFLSDYVLDILKKNGFADLTPANEEEFLPEFTAEAQRRIGAALMPRLSEDAAEAMIKLGNDAKTSPEDWWNFWQKQVPDFKEVVNQALADYAKDLKKVLGGL